MSLVSGAETFTRTDLALGRIYPISIQRRYNSAAGYDSPLGYGWAHNYDKRLYTYADGAVIIRKETGWKRRFEFSGGVYVTPAGEYGTLVQNGDGSFTYTLKDGSREEYDVRGCLVTCVNPRGASLVLTYQSGEREALEGLLPTNVDQDTPLVVAYDYRLARIEERDPSGSSTGVFVTFFYDATSGRLTSLVDSLGRIVNYGGPLWGRCSLISYCPLPATMITSAHATSTPTRHPSCSASRHRSRNRAP